MAAAVSAHWVERADSSLDVLDHPHEEGELAVAGENTTYDARAAFDKALTEVVNYGAHVAAEKDREIAELKAENERLRQRIRDIGKVQA
jgi:hypothetical protein